MPRLQTKRQEQILEKMIARMVARTDLSDVSDVSAFKHLLAAAARSDDEQYYQMTLLLQLFSIDTATGEDLDERAKDIQPGTITRFQAVKANGEVVFSRNSVAGTINIAAGTTVQTADGVAFVTQAAGQITATSPEQIAGHGVGRDSSPVAVLAVEPGAAGNVVANTIIKFSSKPPGVDEVANPNPTLNGQDKETDDAFRARIKNFVDSLARSTVNAIESGTLGAQDEDTGATILYTKVWEDPVNRGYVTLYIDDGAGTAETTEAVASDILTQGLSGPPPDSAVGGEEYLYTEYKPIKEAAGHTMVSSTRGALTEGTHYTINYASGQVVFIPALVTGEVITASYERYTGLIALAQKIVDGDPNDRAAYPGLRAAGVLVTADVPQILIQNLDITLTVLEGYDISTVQTNVKNAIKEYINGLSISGDVIRNEVIKRIQAVSGVYNSILTAPAADVTILDDQLARTTDLNITIA